MSRLWILTLASILLPLLSCADRPPVTIPAGIDHTPYTALLRAYVDADGLVDYDGWRRNAEDVATLDAYLADYAVASETPATGAERHAALINLYNALTIRDVLHLDPEESYWAHDPFDDRGHRVGGREVSLDDVEHGAARPAIGYRVHAALVCAAMSCPPLLPEAYTAADLDAQLDDRMSAWLADPDLNRFDVDKRRAQLSKIFAWFAEDFTDPGLQALLAPYAPKPARPLLERSAFEVGFLPYDKALNAQTPDER